VIDVSNCNFCHVSFHSIIAFPEKIGCRKRYEPIPRHGTPWIPSVTSVKNYDPALRPLDLSNTTSEPLYRRGRGGQRLVVTPFGASHN
jgi:hypothetical protein